MHFIDVMLHKQIEVDKYIIGPSFRDRHLQSFADHLNAGMPLLKDAFIACASHLVGNQNLQQLAQRQQIGYKRAAAAISSLRLAKVHYDDDLTTVLILGVAMVTFALHHSGDTSSLCRHILGIVKSLYDDGYDLMQRLGSDGVAFLICLVSTETEECLVRCRLPTIRIRPGDLDQLIDRFIGVSAPLLTHFYDICELAQRVRLSCRRRSQVPLDRNIEETRARIEQAVEQWQPTVSFDYLADRFTPTEVIRMLAQAKVLRLAALLVTHRLRYAYGSQDDKAVAMSNAILEELDTVIRVSGQSLPFADLAHLVACFEITDPEERRDALVKSHLIVDFSPHVREEQEAWLVSFWAARDNARGDGIFWHDVGPCL